MLVFVPLLPGLFFSAVQSETGFISRTRCFIGGDQVPAGFTDTLAFRHRLEIRHNGKVLVQKRDYLFSTADQPFKLAFPLHPEDSLCVEYFESPIIRRPSFQPHRLENVPVLKKDTAGEGDGVRFAVRQDRNLDRFPRYRLDYGGNKSLMVTVGDEGGMNLEQSLQLDVRGRLADNVFIIGHLSDQEIPIQPEGNSATLREVDQIFVKVYGDHYSYTLGDYLFDFGETDVDKYVAKVQGMNGLYSRGPYRGSLAFSRTRGEYHTYVFSGKFGKQTDYFLRGRNSGQFITVLAGTEKVWKNGERLVRGKHYQIEYGEGRIDFLNTFIVSGEDRYTVEFQYTERDYPSFLYSGGVADTLGNLTWSLRAVSERESRDRPDAFLLSDLQEEVMSRTGDDTSAFSAAYEGPSWREGLYFLEDARYVYVDGSAQYDSLRRAGEPVYIVSFVPSASGPYRKDEQQERYVYGDSSAGGGFTPGKYSQPSARTHYALGISFRSPDTGRQGHVSALTLMLSSLDRNLFSDMHDDDNTGYGMKYDGSQVLGRPLDRKGPGRFSLQVKSTVKNRDYESFRQLIESYRYRETWNMPSGYAEKGYQANRVILEDEVFTDVKVGGEYGYAEGGMLRGGEEGEGANSERLRGFSILGRGDRSLDAFTEKKHANVTTSGVHRRKDNYKTGTSGKYLLGKFIPRASYVRDEWIDREGASSAEMSLKQKWGGGFATRPLFKKLKLNVNYNALNWKSNFLGSSPDYRDSLRSWDVSQKTELFDIGPWQTDLFLSYQHYRKWGIRIEENSYKLMEWNNHLQDYRRGYSAYSVYKINQTEEIPLLQAYEKVPKGEGDYSCDSATLVLGSLPQCIEDPFGAYKRGDLVRDTVIGEIDLQDLSWNGDVSLTPGKLTDLQGVLAHVTLSFRFIFAHQDNSGSPGIIPLFSDGRIKGMLGGRSKYQPSVRWASPKGNKTCHIMFDRKFTKSFSNPRTQKTAEEKITYTHEISSTWSYSLRQNLLLRETGEGGAAAELDTTFRLGGEVEKRVMRNWRLKPAVDGSFSFGRAGSGPAYTERSLFPRLRIERDFLRGGRTWTEYGINVIWGTGQPSFLLRNNGFRKGLTHQVQAGIDLQIGKYVYASGNYLLRKEFPDDEGPGSSDLLQKLTAEVKAIF